MKKGFSEIMAIKETARCLKIGKFSLHKMLREGEIPVVKIENVENNKIITQVPYIPYNHKVNTTKIDTYLSTKDLSVINPLDSLSGEVEYDQKTK